MVRRTIGLGEEQWCLLFGNTGRGDSMLRDYQPSEISCMTPQGFSPTWSWLHLVQR